MNNKAMKNIRYFNDFSEDKGIITKSCNLKEGYYFRKFVNEVLWMAKAPKIIKKYLPTIIDWSVSNGKVFISYEKIPFGPIHDLLFNDKVKAIPWKDIFKAYFDFFDKCRLVKPQPFNKKNWKKKMISFYLSKTINNIKKSLKFEKIRELYSKPSIINGVKCPSLNDVLKYLNTQRKLALANKKTNKYIEQLITPTSNNICCCHLDMVFSNVFYDQKNKKILCIDPRGSFSNSKKYGDITYDYAKICQCVYGKYDFIVADRFDLNVDFNKRIVDFKIKANCKILNALKYLPKYFIDNKKFMRLDEAIQFFNMVPAHKDKINRQIIMDGYALLLMKEFIK